MFFRIENAVVPPTDVTLRFFYAGLLCKRKR